MRKLSFLLFTLLIFFSGCGEESFPVDNISVTTKKTIVENKSKQVELSENEIQNTKQKETLRPVIVTILEHGNPASDAVAHFSNWSENSTWLYVDADKNGVAKFLVPREHTFFRVSAIKDGFAIVSFYTNNLSIGITPIYINLNLEETGIKIAAELISDSEIKIEKLFARIIPGNNKDWTDLDACTSTNCIDNKIIFPAIKSGLENLRITVEGKNIAKSISKKFDTCDNIDKTIPVKLFEGVTLNGMATREDGTAVTNFSFQATPRGQYEKRNNPGHVKTNIKTDEFGNYETFGLMRECYKLNLTTENAEPIITNVWLQEKDNTIDFVFKDLIYKTINGIVLYEETKEPAANIKVEFLPQQMEKNKKSVSTDEGGKFSFSFPGINFHGTIKLNESEFAEINRNVYSSYNGELITLLLREKGMIAGTVTTKDGNPVPGIFVSFYPSNVESRSSARSFDRKNSHWYDLNAYNYKSKTETDEFGDYVISNVAAPEIYYVSIYDNNYFIPQKQSSTLAKVYPDEITICNFQASQMPVIMLKVRDKNHKEIKNYSLKVKARYRDHLMDSLSINTGTISLNETEEWHRVKLRCEDYLFTKWSLKAFTEEEGEARKENISFEKPEAKYIVLTLCSTQEPAISGFVYKPDDLPLIDTRVSTYSDGKSADGRTDYQGYFEILTSQWEDEKRVRLQTSYNKTSYRTNVTVGSKDIEWNLPESPCIIGRVCIDSANVPATNFAVSVYSKYFHGRKWIFKSNDGKFSLPLSERFFRKTGKIYAHVTGFAPTGTDFSFENSKKCDVGNIIVSELPAAINGRVVDHENLPMKVWVKLEKSKNGIREKILNVTSDKNDGTFSFTDLPIGTYFVSVFSQVGKTESEPVELASGEIKTIPDLIVATTNIPMVHFTFLLPDGSPAANADVNRMNETTDENGCIEKRMKIGTYKNWSVDLGDNVYFTKPIVITENSKNIQINLLATPKISGEVFLDGLLLDAVQLDFQGDGQYYSMARNGLFEVRAKPGKYIVSCMERKVVSIVELTEGENNKINFTSGNSAFEFEFPIEGIRLSLKFENRNISLVYLSSSSCKGLSKISKLPSGEYTIFASVYKENVRTNIIRKAILNNNEKKKIVF